MTTSVLVGYPIRLPDVPPLWRGDPFDWKLTMHDAQGVAVPLGGYGSSWWAEARTRTADVNPVQFTIDTTGVAAEFLVLSLSGVQTAGMSRSTYRFDVQASGGARSPFTVWTGELKMTGDYTHA